MAHRTIDAELAISKVKGLVLKSAKTPEARALGRSIMSMLGDERQIPTLKPGQSKEAAHGNI